MLYQRIGKRIGINSRQHQLKWYRGIYINDNMMSIFYCQEGGSSSLLRSVYAFKPTDKSGSVIKCLGSHFDSTATDDVVPVPVNIEGKI